MNNKIIAAVVLGCTIMLSSCQKEEADSLPEGAIQLTTEGFHGNEKTSVSGNTVQWDGSSTESVNINGDDYEVHVSGNHAYINPGGAISAPVRGYYACGSVSTPNGEKPNEVVVEIPDHYDCCMNGDRQVIALPMVAYSSSSNEVVEFKHLTAAVNVLVWNATENDLCVDRVVITVAGHRLHGNLDLNLTNENYDIAASYDDPSSAADSTVSVSFPSSGEGSLVVSPGESNAKSIQVPILPVGNDNEMTVQIYTHVNEASWHKYIFNHHASISNALTRNKMVMARCKIHTGEGNHVYENTFSVNNSQKVFFSPGNLQYQASTTTWRFAEHQYDYIGDNNSNISSTYTEWIDLFGWGTSGISDYTPKATCYQPYSTSTNNADYNAYGNNHYNLFDGNGKADWGYNAISNGGNSLNNGWRTFTIDELSYLLNTRNYAYKYAKAKIHNINGLIIFPDGFNPTAYGLTITSANTFSATFTAYSDENWNRMEETGCVFLPASGYRESTSVYDAGNHGFYWTSTQYNSSSSYRLNFSSSTVNYSNFNARYRGHSVRLVRNAD